MAAIITDTFKRNIIKDILTDVDSQGELYYIGIGRSQPWDSSDTVVAVTNSARSEVDFRLNLQSVKQGEDTSFVTARNNWTAGTIYGAFDSNTVGAQNPVNYIITESNTVYMCLEQGVNVSGNAVQSTVQPTTITAHPQKLADGYVWKFLYTMSAIRANKFLSSNYMPVKRQDSADATFTGIEIANKLIQDSAVDGTIANLSIIAGGSGYTSAPTIAIHGNGDSAQAFAAVAAGSVVKIEMKDSADGLLYRPGYNYDYASVVFSGGGGTGAQARANISHGNGFGDDPRIDVKSTALMFNTKPAGGENEDFIIDQDFRQVGLMRRLKKGVSAVDSDFTSATGSANPTMTLSAITGTFTADKTILGSTSAAKAFIDKFDSDTIYYHQDSATGFLSFVAGEGVTETNGSGAGTIGIPHTNGDIDRFKGEVLYIDNRAAVVRSSSQTEDIKIIIQL